ncbi:MAG: bifunctional hydroxymethylpyrimidine kinase/phosphomethylpyrimidine kinase [Clostridia bacterium]|nr:bifunctional hydroxymethylpyrimidine kinase/phosphomethylpyrimidine kinase [Clostridia bacterium]
MKTVLSIAGSDCSGGAGIQADIKTITAHSLYAMTAITALTAQNTTGVYSIETVSADFLAAQLDCIFTDIFPDAIKTGMLASPELIEVIALKLSFFSAKNTVIDPVLFSTSNTPLLNINSLELMINKLFPLASVITPNLHEAEILSGIDIRSKSDMEKAAISLYGKTHTAVLIKGGHLTGSADDLLYDGDRLEWFCGKRIANPNTHGTGCTLSSAIACNLAVGKTLSQSIQAAKDYLSAAIALMLDFGKGNGPLGIPWGSAPNLDRF